MKNVMNCIQVGKKQSKQHVYLNKKRAGIMLALFLIGGIVALISIILGVILIKATAKSSYVGYVPATAFFAVGLVCLLIATLTKIEVMGAGLGGWGIACLFAGAIGFVITSTFDAF